MSKKIYLIMLFIIIAISILLFLLSLLKIESLITVLILAITAYAIALQGFATEEMARNQIRPSVDVSMIFNKKASGTLFQFINITKVPALVWITVDIKNKNGEKVELNNDYVTGKKRIDIDVKSWITSPGFLKGATDKNEKIEAILRIDVAPVFDEKARSRFQEKFYRFDAEKKEWIRTPFWGIAEEVDSRFLIIKSNKKNEDRN